MQYKPYLCISCSLTPGVKRWIKTFKNSGVASQVRLIIFMWEPYFDNDVEEVLDKNCDYVIYKQESKYINNRTARLPLLELLKKNKTLLNEWFVWTDCHDVVFQKELPEFWINSNKDAIICSEHLKHGESDYWLPLITGSKEFEHLYDKEVYNSGVFAMRGFKIFNYFCELNKPTYPNRYGKSELYIDNQYDGDQLIFNKWVHNNISCCDVNSEIFLALYTGYIDKNWVDMSTYSKFDNGKFISQDGKIFPIVHANGNVNIKEILNFHYN